MALITLTPRSCVRSGTASRMAATLAANAALCIGVSFDATAQAVTYRLDPAHTQVQWEVLHFGTSTSRGRFAGPAAVSGQLQLDARAGTGEVSISINMASVDTGVRPLDGVLRASYLASGTYPQAWFVANGWRWRPDAPLEVRGELTLRGMSRPLVLRSPTVRCQPHPMLAREVCGADLTGDLQRSDFGITDGLPFIGDRVRLQISVEAVRDPTNNDAERPSAPTPAASPAGTSRSGSAASGPV